MKRLAQTGIMFAGLAVLPLGAQSTSPSPSPSTRDMSPSTEMMSRTSENMSRTTDTGDHDFNFGWLGLLGLAGLAGLARKKHDHDHMHTDHVHSGPMHTGMDRDRM